MERDEFNKILKAYTKAADSAMSQGNPAIAERFYLDALKFAIRRFGEESNEAAFTYFSLSLFYVSANMLDEARRAATMTVEILKKSVGETNPTTAIAIHHLDQICEHQGLGSVEKHFGGQALESLKLFVENEQRQQSRPDPEKSQESKKEDGGNGDEPEDNTTPTAPVINLGSPEPRSFHMFESVADTMHGADH